MKTPNNPIAESPVDSAEACIEETAPANKTGQTALVTSKLRFIAGKFIRGLSLLIGLSALAFILVRTSPVDPVLASVNYDMSLTEQQYQAIAEYWGLNEPPVTQYFVWLKNMLSGNMGTSRIYRKPVAHIIRSRAGASCALMGISWILSGIIGFLLGTTAAFKRGSALDTSIKWFSYLQASVPAFWVGLIFLLIFAVWLDIFPIGISVPIGIARDSVTLAERLHHLILPVLTLSVLGIANVTLHTREKMIDVLSSEYILFARARGETKCRHSRHYHPLFVFRRAVRRFGAGGTSILISGTGINAYRSRNEKRYTAFTRNSNDWSSLCLCGESYCRYSQRCA